MPQQITPQQIMPQQLSHHHSYAGLNPPLRYSIAPQQQQVPNFVYLAQHQQQLLNHFFQVLYQDKYQHKYQDKFSYQLEFKCLVKMSTRGSLLHLQLLLLTHHTIHRHLEHMGRACICLALHNPSPTRHHLLVQRILLLRQNLVCLRTFKHHLARTTMY